MLGEHHPPPRQVGHWRFTGHGPEALRETRAGHPRRRCQFREPPGASGIGVQVPQCRGEPLVGQEPQPADGRSLPLEVVPQDLQQKQLSVLPDRDPEGGKKTIEQGAATLDFAAASPLLDGVGGVYLKDSDVAELDDTEHPLTAQSIPSMANSAMLNADDARRLWELSERLTA